MSDEFELLNVYSLSFLSTTIFVRRNLEWSDIWDAVSDKITNVDTIYLVRPLLSALPRHTHFEDNAH